MKLSARVSLIASIAIVCAALPSVAQADDYDQLDKYLKGPLPVPSSTSGSYGAAGTTTNAASDIGNNGAAMPAPSPDSAPAPALRGLKQPATAATASSNPNPVAAFNPNYDALKDAVPNFHVVSPTLLRGGQPTADGLMKLRAAGVKTVVDLRNEDVLVKQEASEARAAGLEFVNIPLDVFNPPPEATIRQFLRIVDNGARTNSPVYVHCLHGQDRTGTFIAIYRIERQGWSADQAYSEMLSRGFRPGFCRLSQAVFAHGASAGRPGSPPTGGDIVADIKRRLIHQK